MQAPWATGLGTLAVLAILATFLFSVTPIVAAVFAVGFLGAVLIGFMAKRADADNPTPGDPVTGGRRWWQKRWDE